MSAQEQLLDAIRKVAGERDGRVTLACADAFKLAAERGCELLDVARVCNANNIKIVECQLGCFQ